MHAETTQDDEVVYQTDVYLASSLQENLYIMHYPTRSANFQQDDFECLSARIKPKQHKVELEIGLNTESSNFDEGQAKMIAENADDNATEEPMFRNNMMDRYTLSGGSACSSTEKYAVGLLQNGDLHLTPVHAIVDLRPTFSHMDKIDARSRKDRHLDEENEEEAVAVTVRFEHPNAEKGRERMQKSYQYLQQKSASEPWIKFNYHKAGSQHSKKELEKLLCSNADRDVTNQGIKPDEYLSNLLPECLRLSGHSVVQEETAILANKPIPDQIHNLLLNAQVMPFSLLQEKLPFISDVSVLNRMLQHSGVLVRGNWTVKSEFIFPDNTVSPFTGVSSKLLTNVRDYVLWLFNSAEYISFKEVLAVCHVPDEDLKNIISPLATKTCQGWKFKYPVDRNYTDNNLALSESQNIKWNLRYNKIVKELNIGMQELEDLRTKPRSKRNSYSRSSCDEPSSCDEGLPSTSLTPSKKRRHPSAKSRPVSCVKKLPLATLDINRSFGDPLIPESVMTELKDALSDAMKNCVIMTETEVKDFIGDGNLKELVTRNDLSMLIEQVMENIGARNVKNKWPQNTTPEPLYAQIRFGNKLDRYRNAVLDLFSTTARARPSFLMKKVEDEMRELISETDCRQLFEEYCLHKSGFYYLKGTISLDSLQ